MSCEHIAVVPGLFLGEHWQGFFFFFFFKIDVGTIFCFTVLVKKWLYGQYK